MIYGDTVDNDDEDATPGVLSDSIALAEIVHCPLVVETATRYANIGVARFSLGDSGNLLNYGFVLASPWNIRIAPQGVNNNLIQKVLLTDSADRVPWMDMDTVGILRRKR